MALTLLAYLLYVLLAVPTLLGLFLLYCIYRYGRHPRVDRTASPATFLMTVWELAMRPGEYLGQFPWMARDLGEILRPETEDDEVT